MALLNEDRKVRPNNFGDAAAAMADPTVKAAPPMFNKTPAGTMLPQKTGAPATTSAAAAGVQSGGFGFMPDTRAVYKESGKAISDLASQGRYGAAAGETARAALAYVPAVVSDIGRGVANNPINAGVVDGVKQFAGFNDGPRAANESQAKNPASNVGTTPKLTPEQQRSQDLINQPTQRGQVDMSLLQKPGNRAPVNTPNGFTQVADGIYRKGNSFTDEAGMQDKGFAARGAVSLQNQRAADVLAQRSTAGAGFGIKPDATNAPQPAAQPAFQGGFDREASIRALSDITSPEYRALRSLKMDADSEAEQRSRMGRGFKGAGAGEAYNALLGELTTGTREGQTDQMKDATTRYGIDQQNVREGMSQEGANARAALTAGLQAGELGLKREAQGFQTRAARGLEEAQQSYLGAKTPEEKQSALEKLQVLQGKFGGSSKDYYMTVDGGVNDQGIKQPGRVFDTRTRQFIPDARPATTPANRPVGTTSTVSGKSAVWDGKQWVPQ